jgi:hypothetical protein
MACHVLRHESSFLLKKRTDQSSKTATGAIGNRTYLAPPTPPHVISLTLVNLAPLAMSYGALDFLFVTAMSESTPTPPILFFFERNNPCFPSFSHSHVGNNNLFN